MGQICMYTLHGCACCIYLKIQTKLIKCHCESFIPALTAGQCGEAISGEMGETDE